MSFLDNFGLSVNKTALQNVLQHHFLQPRAVSEVVETAAQIRPQVVCKKAAPLFKNYSSQPPRWHILNMAHILRRFQSFGFK
jgi:hypothetical protein